MMTTTRRPSPLSLGILAVVVEPGEEGVFAPSFYVDEALSGPLTGAAAGDDLVTVIVRGDPCATGM